jgi:YidC/Oxa1 family membrane protein insertase
MGIGELWNLILVDPMTNVLVGLARVFGGNFGISIIIFTIAMRIATWPLTASQYKQSKKMQEIQPKMQELQKKYKGKDPKKLQSETMGLYKEAGINPLGCLIPMLVQFPIWIALYRVINISLGETPESFVGLSDTLYPIPFIHEAVPLDNRLLFWNLGQPDATFILPVIVAISMYVQQKLITPQPVGQLTEAQRQQQQTTQMMTWMMPLIFGFWSLSVPAGLALYWGVSNLSGIVFQYFYMGRRMDWRNLVSFGPPPTTAPVPAARGEQKQAASAPPKPDVEAQDADVTVSESGKAAVGPQPQSARRNKHGRRRGKR